MLRRLVGVAALVPFGCSAGVEDGAGGSSVVGATSATTVGQDGSTASTASFMGTGEAPCPLGCSSDLHAVVDCNDDVVEACSGLEGCNPITLVCANACDNATETKQSVGCEYFAVDMEMKDEDDCYAVFVANTWDTAVHLQLEVGGEPIAFGPFAQLPQGEGAALTYVLYDPSAGLAPGDVAILFLTGSAESDVPCPVQPALPAEGPTGTGIGRAFRLRTEAPVVAYQMNPYGGGTAAVTGASLLLPTSAWDTNYVAVNAAPAGILPPSLNIVAMDDDTTVTLLPEVPIEGGPGIPSGAANVPLSFTLDRGRHAQITQDLELTGSVIQTDKPVGVFAGHPCMNWPSGVSFCDHGEQMVPPLRALGSRYAAVMHRPRGDEPAFYRLIGAVDGTQLDYSSAVGGPATLGAGEHVMFSTDVPFVVESQDEDHPFLLFTYMTGSGVSATTDGKGDPDMVVGVPVAQYMTSYVFFADPTYPETNLVLVRTKLAGELHDVELDCAGTVTGWQPLGDLEWTRVDLTTGDFESVSGCSTGRHQIRSKAPFGLWIWGWGTFDSNPPTPNVSYGYPGGMNLRFVNEVVIPAVPQ